MSKSEASWSVASDAPTFLVQGDEMGNGEWGMGNGEWRMENGEWRMENGEWRMENGEWGMELESHFAIRNLS